MDSFNRFFSSAGFYPHAFCLLWRPDLLALHITSDAVIAASYFSIPLAILYFVRRRTDLIAEHKRIAVLFGVFILGCGMTHVMSVVVLWWPFYGVDGLIKAFTAVVSIITAIALWPVLPRLLEIPSPGQLALANAQLQAEIVARQEALNELQAIRDNLEVEVARRTEELRLMARRFQIATEGSKITVTEQDADLRYTWRHNARAAPGYGVGKTDVELFGAKATASLLRLKRKVMKTGEPGRGVFPLTIDGEAFYYELKITRAPVGDGDGLLVAAVDITEQKQQQEHLQVILRELAHRAKNLLALVEGIARQSAKAERLPASFIKRFGDRLAALGAAYDLMIGRDWRGAELSALIASQLAPVLAGQDGRISIDGPPVELAPEAGQYLALALHELATNVIKYGALRTETGGVDIRWRIEDLAGEGARIELSWIEHGVTKLKAGPRGFGRLLLESIVPRALKANADWDLGEGGLSWKISFANPTATFGRS